jgi:hypothetical protein
MVAGERRAPVFQYPDQASIGDERRRHVFHHDRQPRAMKGGVDEQVTDTLAAAETASFCSGVCGRFAQQAKRSCSNQGFKVAFGRHQKLCIFDEEADLQIAIERVVSGIGAARTPR